MKSSRRTYFRIMASAKKTHWSDFLSSATPHSHWTAKGLALSCSPQRFPDLPGASDPAQVAETLLQHLFPPNGHPPRTSASRTMTTIPPSLRKRYPGPSPNPQAPRPLPPTTSCTLCESLYTSSSSRFSGPAWTPC